MKTGFFRNWTRQARKGLLELAILNDISHHGMYGYEIEARFCKAPGLLLGGGTIYAILRRFRSAGFVKATQAASPNGPKRKYYELTTMGRETLTQMNSYWKAVAGQITTITRGR